VNQQINLFNPTLQRQQKLFSAVAIVQALLVIGIGGMALTAFMSYRVAGIERLAEAGRSQVAQREALLVKVTREFAPRKRDDALAQEVAEMEANLNVLQDAKDMLLRGDFGNAVGYSVYLRGLARQSVAGVWLTRLTIAGDDIGIEGNSVRADLVPHYIRLLAAESAFQGKSFGGLDITGPDDAASKTGAGKEMAILSTAAPAPSAPSVAAPGIFKFTLRAAGPLTKTARSTK
jgi:hypothetical protein